VTELYLATAEALFNVVDFFRTQASDSIDDAKSHCKAWLCGLVGGASNNRYLFHALSDG